MSLRNIWAHSSVWFFVLFLFLGASTKAVQAQTEPPEPPNLPISVCAPMYRDGLPMCLNARDATPLNNRIPILLIHGWSHEWPGPPSPEVWDNFVAYQTIAPWVTEKFKFYNVTYYSNLVSVSDIGRILAELVDQIDALDPNFANQKLFLIGYSMGGLVARSFMQEWRLQSGLGLFGGERVLRLVTLATPHHGTPLANGPARDAQAGTWLGWIIRLVDSMLFKDVPWSNYNRYDLHADSWLASTTNLDYNRFPQDANIWLDYLNARNSYPQKISTYGGVINAWSDWDNEQCPVLDNLGGDIPESDLLDCSASLMKGLYDHIGTDGIVPNGASLDSTVYGHETLFGYNHIQMVAGKSPSDSFLFGAILADLSDFVWSGDDRFDFLATFGTDSEPFHNLRGWGTADKDQNGVWFRYHVPDLINTADVFIQNPGIPSIISFTRGDRSCEDDLDAYIKVNGIDVPLYIRRDGQVSSQFGFPYQRSVSEYGYAAYQYRIPVSSFEVRTNRITIEFINSPGQNKCGPTPMYSVSVYPQ